MLKGDQVPAILWRVHKTERGALNPPPRTGTPDKTWSRFDIPGWATLYGATARKGAYVEALAGARFGLSLAGLFDDESESVERQWRALGHMAPKTVARQWRDYRQLSAFKRHITKGLVVDLAASETIAYLRGSVSEWASLELQADPLKVDLSLITGGDREATSKVAWWLSRTVLTHGEPPIGVLYPSKHGADLQCYGFWVDLDRYGPGKTICEVVAEEYRVDSTEDIKLNDRDLQHAGKLLGLRLF